MKNKIFKKRKPLKENLQPTKKLIITVLLIGTVLIILINTIIVNYCKPIGNFCLGMEYYPIELVVYNILLIIPFFIVLSVFFSFFVKEKNSKNRHI